MRRKHVPKIIAQGLSDEERGYMKLYSLKELELFRERTEDELKGTIAECTAIINTAEEEMRKHPDYIRAKEMLAPLEKSFRDTKRFQDCKRDLASYLLKSGKTKKAPPVR
jgi:hypothetical protein